MREQLQECEIPSAFGGLPRTRVCPSRCQAVTRTSALTLGQMCRGQSLSFISDRFATPDCFQEQLMWQLLVLLIVKLPSLASCRWNGELWYILPFLFFPLLLVSYFVQPSALWGFATWTLRFWKSSGALALLIFPGVHGPCWAELCVGRHQEVAALQDQAKHLSQNQNRNCGSLHNNPLQQKWW